MALVEALRPNIFLGTAAIRDNDALQHLVSPASIDYLIELISKWDPAYTSDRCGYAAAVIGRCVNLSWH